LGVPIVGESAGGEPVQADSVAACFHGQFAVAEECRFSLAKIPSPFFCSFAIDLKTALHYIPGGMRAAL